MGGLSAIREIEEYKYFFFSHFQQHEMGEREVREMLERKRLEGAVLRHPYLGRTPLDRSEFWVCCAPNCGL